MSVYINGDRSNFLSKGKIKKLKEELKKLEKPYNFSSIKYKDYLKEGNGFTIKVTKNDFNVNIISEKEAKKEELRKKLRGKILSSSHNTSGAFHKVLNEEKKNVDKTLYKKYRQALASGNKSNVIPPSEVMANPDKYKQMISIFSSDMFKKQGSSAIRNYYETLRQKLNIPKYSPPPPNPPQNLDFSVPDKIVEKTQLNEEVDTEDEEDETKLNENVETVEKENFKSHPNYYDWKSTYPFLEELQKNIDVIREEVSAIDGWRDWPEKNLYNEDGAKWTVFPFLHTFPATNPDKSTWVESSCAKCPRTAAALKRIPGIRTALFSRMGRNTSLKEHRGWADLSNHVLRCHLPLIVPGKNKCGLWVRGEVQYHTEGEIIVFDDSKLHKAFNTSDQDRIVLLFDIMRPDWVSPGTSKQKHTDQLDRALSILNDKTNLDKEVNNIVEESSNKSLSPDSDNVITV